MRVRLSFEKSDALWREHLAAPTHETKNALWGFYYPVVEVVAERLARRLAASVQVGDLVGAGVFGLLNAIDRFDPARGFKFLTFARARIKGAMLDWLRKVDPVPRLTRTRLKRFQRARSAIEARHGRRATDREMALELEISLGELAALELELRPLLVQEEQGIPFHVDVMELRLADASSEDPADRAHYRDFFDGCLRRLPARQQEILVMHYIRGWTLKEIGDALGFSESLISQLHSRALQVLRFGPVKKQRRGRQIGFLSPLRVNGQRPRRHLRVGS